jgi:hypothetical protein
VPITAAAGLPTAEEWWRQLGVVDPDALPVQPPLSVAAQRRSFINLGYRLTQELLGAALAYRVATAAYLR